MRKKDNYIINEEIDIPEELDKRINSRIQGLKKSKSIGECITIVIFSLIVISATAIRFNPDINAYASKIPVISEIMSWFKSDKGVQYAKEKGYDVYESNFEKDGYKLYIKDLYLDKRNVDMKFAVEDEEGNYLNNIQWELFYPQLAYEVRYDSNTKKQDPWQQSSITLYDPMDYENINKLKINLKVKKNKNSLVVFDNIEIDIKENKILPAKKYNQQCKGNFDIAEIEVKELRILPAKMYLKYKVASNYDGYTTPFVQSPKLIDDKGNIYESTSIFIENKKDIQCEAVFEPSFYFDSFPKELKLVFDSISTTNIKDKFFIDTSKEVLKNIRHDGRDFTLYKVERDEDYLKVYVKSEYELREHNFPHLSIKNNRDYCVGEIERKDNTRNYIFTKVEVEKVLGNSIENVLKLQGEKFEEAITGFREYFFDIIQEGDMNYNERYFRMKLSNINEDGSTYIRIEKDEKSREQVYYFRYVPESETYEFCVLGDSVPINGGEIELNIK